MPLKHIAFQDIEAEAWARSQARWLELSVSSGGLRSAWAAVRGTTARAVFDWESDDALRGFMEHSHDRALAEAGAVGKSAVLHLTPLLDAGPRGDAGFVGESIAWLKEGSHDGWIAAQQTWFDEMKRCDGFVGGSLARGRRTFVFTSFWRDEAAHTRFVHDVVPELRARTSDELVARLTRFDGPLVAALCR